jgi:phosphoglycerate dehydrogenase-like enzyme
MLHRTPDEHVIQLALARWQNAGKGRPKLGVGFAGWSNTGRVGKNLAELDADVTAEALVDEQGRVAPALREADVLVSGGQVLNGPIYDQLSCRVILRPYVGYNDIDVPAASERGILVCNVPDAYSEEVAMQAIAFLMAANRQLFAYDDLGIPLVSLDEVLQEADYVLLHAFLWEETHHMINAEKLAKMKPGAWLINTARGPLVDEKALIDALKGGHLAGAGLDVTEVEPIEMDNPLLTMPNVMISPHMAVYSEEGQVRSADRTAGIARATLAGHLPDRVPAIDKGLYDALLAHGITVHADMAKQ